MLRLKIALARLVGRLSRASRRGGGTSLPGKLLLRLAPDAVSVLGHRLPRGSVIVSATNGKTTTAGMIAQVREPRRRPLYFGVEDHSHALPELEHAFDAKHCRRCGAAYSYERAYLGHLGDYSCPQCGNARPRPDVAATEIAFEGMAGSRVKMKT